MKIVEYLDLIEAVEGTDGTPLLFERTDNEKGAIEFKGPEMEATVYVKARAIEFRVSERFEGFAKGRGESLSALFLNESGKGNTLAKISRKVALLNVRILLCEQKKKAVLEALRGFRDDEEMA